MEAHIARELPCHSERYGFGESVQNLYDIIKNEERKQRG